MDEKDLKKSAYLVILSLYIIDCCVAYRLEIWSYEVLKKASIEEAFKKRLFEGWGSPQSVSCLLLEIDQSASNSLFSLANSDPMFTVRVVLPLSPFEFTKANIIIWDTSVPIYGIYANGLLAHCFQYRCPN